MHLMSASLRQELAPWGIHVTCVEPGTISTEIWGKGEAAAEELMAGMSDEHRRLYGRRVSSMNEAVAKQARRGIAPEKVAEAVERALTARRPKAYELVGADARGLTAMQVLLPVRLRDAVIRRALGV
jgi:NAD(P)-dependent dehydrogenase (short-subunit alcohol dehydrogenase family)